MFPLVFLTIYTCRNDDRTNDAEVLCSVFEDIDLYMFPFWGFSLQQSIGGGVDRMRTL